MQSVTFVLVTRTSVGGILARSGRDRRCPHDKRAHRAKEALDVRTVTPHGSAYLDLLLCSPCRPELVGWRFCGCCTPCDDDTTDSPGGEQCTAPVAEPLPRQTSARCVAPHSAKAPKRRRRRSSPSPAYWADEVQYGVIVAVPSVRNRVAAAAAAATPPMSVEKFLGLAEWVIPTAGFSAAVANLAHPIYVRMGARTSKERTQLVPRPTGWSWLMSCARWPGADMACGRFSRALDGCVLQFILPPTGGIPAAARW
jgi:hypothetical protein